MQRIRDFFIRFMYGRRGIDKLGTATVITAIILSVLNMFIGSTVLGCVIFVLEVLFIYRAFSRDIYKRQRECDAFERIFGKTVAAIKLFFCRIRDIFKKRYRRCKHCGAVLRLPVKRGTHTVNCPRCRQTFTVKIII